MLARCGSPAEAYFLRRLFESSSTLYAGKESAYCRGVTITPQVRCHPYRIDVVAKRGRVRVALEIDGFEYHSSRAQVASDYHRQRRLLCAGYIVMRFTASEAMARPAECWRDVFSAIRAHASLTDEEWESA
jgi:very-short-patch-repair endonuclease